MIHVVPVVVNADMEPGHSEKTYGHDEEENWYATGYQGTNCLNGSEIKPLRHVTLMLSAFL